MTTSNEHNNAPAVPVYQLAKLGGPTETAWIDVTQEVYEDAGFFKNDFKRRILYATPATAPAVPQGEPVAVAAWLKAKIEKHALLAADCPGSSSVVLKSALLRFLDRLPPAAATQAPAPAQEFNKSVADAEIKAMYVESQGSDKGWLGIEGSYFIGGVVAARKQKAALAPAQGEPFGHFRVEPFGWTDCAKDDEGAIALYERPQEVGLTDEEIEAIAKKHMSTVGDHWCNEDAIRERHAEDFARAIIAALRAKGGKHV